MFLGMIQSVLWAWSKVSSGYVSSPSEQGSLIEDCCSVSKSKPLAIKLNTSKWLGSSSPEHSSKGITYQSCGTGFIRELHGEVFWVHGISAVQNLSTGGIYRRQITKKETPVSKPIEGSEPGLNPHLRRFYHLWHNLVMRLKLCAGCDLQPKFPSGSHKVIQPRKDRCSPYGWHWASQGPQSTKCWGLVYPNRGGPVFYKLELRLK